MMKEDEVEKRWQSDEQNLRQLRSFLTKLDEGRDLKWWENYYGGIDWHETISTIMALTILFASVGVLCYLWIWFFWLRIDGLPEYEIAKILAGFILWLPFSFWVGLRVGLFFSSLYEYFRWSFRRDINDFFGSIKFKRKS